MEYSTVLELILQLGLPTTMCLLLGWYVKYKDDKNREDFKELMKEHKEETDKFADALNKNTLVLQHLADKLGGNDD